MWRLVKRWWQWWRRRYLLTGYREPGFDTGSWRTRQTLYWHRTYREPPHGR